MTTATQNLSSHRRWYPLYHFVAAPILTVNVLLAAWHAYRIPTRWNMWYVVVAFALAALAFTARVMALTVQDRLIRLEQRMRMQSILPATLMARFGDLSRRQIVGLRFAGDDELTGLVERCLAGELKNDEDVKKQVRNWQPDWIRA